MPILEGNYTASELETIVTHALVRDGFLPDEKGSLQTPENIATGLSKRSPKSDKVFICQIYQKPDSKKNRRLALFAAVTDLSTPQLFQYENNGITETLSNLEGILKYYKNSELEADELIIPIMLCSNRHDNHWTFLQIKKTGRSYTAVLFDPASKISTLSARGINYIESQIKSTFNCILVRAPLGQQPKPTLYAAEKNSGVYTTENIISIIQGNTPHPKLSKDEELLRREHNELHMRTHVKPSEQLNKATSWEEESSSSASPGSVGSSPGSVGSSSDSESSAQSQTKIKSPDRSPSPASSPSSQESLLGSDPAPAFVRTSSRMQWGSHHQILSAVTARGQATGEVVGQTAAVITKDEEPAVPDQVVPQDHETGVRAASKDEVAAAEVAPPAEHQGDNNRNAEAAGSGSQAAAAPPLIEPVQVNNEKTAFDYLAEIQQTIIRTKDWKTKLGGEDAYFYEWQQDPNDQSKKIQVTTHEASVPIGVKLILNAIRGAQEAANKLPEQNINEKQQIYNNAFVEIKRIAKERLDHPRFSFWIFKVRSDITTQFYKDILNYDPENKIKARAVVEISNPLVKK